AAFAVLNSPGALFDSEAIRGLAYPAFRLSRQRNGDRLRIAPANRGPMPLRAGDNPFVSLMATLQEYIQMSSMIPGWTRNEDAEELARASFSLSRDAIIVEIGAFLGCCTVLLAGARCVAGSGKVHSVDP